MQPDRSREVRIKRANTDWWIHEKAMVGANGLTYIVYCTDMGEIHIKELDAKCSRAPSRDFTLCRLNCNYADEHNAPSLCVTEDGTIIVAYTGHAATATLKYRVTTRPYDIFSFGPEKTLRYDKSVTYAQLSENSSRGELWLFCRVDRVTWEFRYSADKGNSWSEPSKFLASDAGGLFYFDVRRMLTRSGERWHFALYGHPLVSKDHTIRSGLFNADGDLLTMDGKKTEFNLYRGGLMKLDELAVVYASPEGTTCRLLAVSPTEPYRVGFAAFTCNQPETLVYYAATWRDGCWNRSEAICTGGEFLSEARMVDGSQTYVGGMAYYWGVGEAGLYPRDIVPTSTNRIYIARYDGTDRVLESYVSDDWGRSYKRESLLRRIPGALGIKIWRPTVPAFAQDNLPVYWHEGSYGAHTGGWHSDAVMMIEYDD